MVTLQGMQGMRGMLQPPYAQTHVYIRVHSDFAM